MFMGYKSDLVHHHGKLTPNSCLFRSWSGENPHQKFLLLTCNSRDISAEGIELKNEGFYPGNSGKTPGNSKHFGEDLGNPKACKSFCLGKGS